MFEGLRKIIIPNKQDLTIPIRNVNSKDLPKYWDRDYIIHKISMIKNHKHKMLMQFLWMTGCRVGEAVLVQKKDLDFQNYTAMIKWQKSRKYHYRGIPLHPKLRDVLELFTATLKFEDRVFPITRQRAWQLVQKYFEGHPHQFRHSFAVNWLRCGGNIVVLSKMLGHSKINTTMEYLKIVPTDQGKELLKIDF